MRGSTLLCALSTVRRCVGFESYVREGWACVRGLVDAPTMATLRESADRLEALGASFTEDTRTNGVFYEVQSASGRKRERAIAPGVLRKLTGPSKQSMALNRLRSDDRVLAAARACGVHDPRCVVDQLNLKHPFIGSSFPFHQDSAFVIGAAARDLGLYGGVHMVLALDRSDADNGGFEVLGRTHTKGIVDLAYDTSAPMDRGASIFDETHRTLVTLEPGDAILFHPNLAHGSGPNISERRRRLVTLWFVGGEPPLKPAPSGG